MKKNIIEKLKQVFADSKVEDVNLEAEATEVVAEVESEVTEEIKFVEVKTTEGRILRADDIAVDQAIVEITEEGEVALEDGEYTMEDENILVVVGGIITDILVKEDEDEEEAAPTEEEAPAEEVVVEEMSAEEAQLFSDISAMVLDFNSIKVELAELKAENEALVARVNKFAGEPSAESTNTTVVFKNETKEDKLKFFGRK